MITYARLAENPTSFLPLAGLTRDEFGRLFDAFTTADAHRAARTRTKRGAARSAGPPGPVTPMPSTPGPGWRWPWCG